ncbi:MAG: heparinase II/III family protein [Victivallales bacterium]|nr:heparinase II/III family protein [Victivallales bacterium]
MRSFVMLLLMSGYLLAETALPLVNPGFEEQGKGWSGLQFISFVKEAAHSGEYGVRVIDTETNGGSVFECDRLPVMPGKYYAIRFWGRSPSGSVVAGVYSRFSNAKGKRIPYSEEKRENAVRVGTKAWTLYTLIAKAPKEAAYMDIWLHSFDAMTGQSDFDDFSIAELTEDEAKKLQAKVQNVEGRFTPPSRERIAEIAELLSDRPQGCGPTGAERERWLPFLDSPHSKNYIKRAERQLDEEPVFMDDEVYLEFSRNGNRTNYQRILGRRSTRLSTFVFAELVEWKGRFLPALENELTRLFSEKSWTLPAHDGNLYCFKQIQQHGDLAATELVAELAQIDWWFQDKLSPAIRQKLREECLRRVLDPYRLDMRKGTIRSGQWWVIGGSNWNAVCTCNVVRAGMVLLDDKMERAEILADMEVSNPFFLKGFTPDGYCSEGVGYWGYGFGHFTIMAEVVLEVTGGKLNIYDNAPNIEAICSYARDIQIDEGICPAFADCGVKARPDGQILALIQRHFPQTVLKRIPPLTTLGSYSMTPLRLFTDETAFAAKVPEEPTFPSRSLFEDAGIYIGRSAADEKGGRFGVAFKAGHNGEQHNHNDVGSFVVVLNKFPYIVDPGGEIYTKRTFSKERYVSQMLNSFGHSVPVVAGKLQSGGRGSYGKFISTEFTDDKDVLVCDLKEAYHGIPELKSLIRTFTFDRVARKVVVRDEVEYTSPQSFATALVSYQDIRAVDGGKYAIFNGKGGVIVQFASEGAEVSTEVGEIINENSTNPKRIGIALATPVQRGSITVTVEVLPEDFELPGFYQAPDEKVFQPQMARAIAIEAENICLQEGGEIAITPKPGASKEAFKYWDKAGHKLGWKVEIPADGKYAIQLRLASGNQDTEALRKVSIDGKLIHPEAEPLAFPLTAGWANTDPNDWGNFWMASHQKAVIVTLTKGTHTLVMENVNNKGLNLDWIKFVPAK